MTRCRTVCALAALTIGLIAVVPSGLSSPKRGASSSDTLVVAGIGTPTGLDTEYFAGTPVGWEITTNIYDTRIYYKTNRATGTRSFTQYGPHLFVSWTHDKTATVWTFKLRKGVKSCTGDEMTAQDAKWSMDRAFALKAVGAFVNAQANLVKPDQVKVIDRYTIQYKLTRPSGFVYSDLVVWTTPLLDSTEVKKHATNSDPWAKSWLATHAAGFGAYCLKELVPGVQVVLTANPNYWAGAPQIKTVIYKAVPDASSRTALVKTGDVDVALALSSEELSSLSHAPNIVLSQFRSNQILGIFLNVKSPPLDNKLLRQALSYAVPYNQILRDVYQGFADPAGSYVPSMYPGYTKRYFPYKTDLNKAKQLLKQSGVSTPVNLSLSLAPFHPEDVKVGVALRSSFASIGVNLKLDVVTPAKYQQLALTHKAQMLMSVALQSHVIDPVFEMDQFSAPPPLGGLDYGNYDNPKLNQLFRLALTFPIAQSKLLALVGQMQKVMADDPPWLVIAVPKYVVAHSKKVSGFIWKPDTSLVFDELHKT
jgi:peptide/nickel transport system substrate-binding protein